jgi:hypothetical protein
MQSLVASEELLGLQNKLAQLIRQVHRHWTADSRLLVFIRKQRTLPDTEKRASMCSPLITAIQMQHRDSALTSSCSWSFFCTSICILRASMMSMPPALEAGQTKSWSVQQHSNSPLPLQHIHTRHSNRRKLRKQTTAEVLFPRLPSCLLRI